MAILFVNRFFFPDFSATSQMLTDLAFALGQQGYEIHVITSRQRYDNATANLPVQETIHGVHVYRVRTTRFGRGGLFGRAVDYASFYLSASWRLWRVMRAGDVVVALTDPPLISVPVSVIAWFCHASLVNWLQDIFPEIAIRLDVKLFRGVVGELLRWMRNASLNAAGANIALGKRMAELLQTQGIPAARIQIIHNWANGADIHPVPHEANPLRRAWGLEDNFVVVYSGNMGRAHEFTTLLDAAERLQAEHQHPADSEVALFKAERHKQEAVFVLIGSGYWLPWLKSEVARRGLSNVRFQPYQPRERLIHSLGVGDVHLISLLPSLDDVILPSKFYGIAAAGRAVLYVGAETGDIPAILREAACGYTVPVGDGMALAERIQYLRNNPKVCLELGVNGRIAFDHGFDQSIAIGKWAQVLTSLCAVETFA